MIFSFTVNNIYSELKRINECMLSNDEDYASALNHIGYNKGDTIKAHRLSNKLYWTEYDAMWIYTALGRYRKQLLREYNIDYIIIESPFGKGNETSSLSLNDLDQLKWGPPKKIKTQKGDHKLVSRAINLPSDPATLSLFKDAFELLYRTQYNVLRWELGISPEQPNQWNNYKWGLSKWEDDLPEIIIPRTDFNPDLITLHYEDYLLPYQPLHVKQLIYALQNNNWSAIDGSDAGTGKCHGKGTLIKMFNGSVKKVENIIVGDLLMGDDSTSRKVLSLARGVDDMYEIIPNDKYSEPFICNKEHILVLRYHKRKFENSKYIRCSQEIKEIAVKDYLRQTETTKKRDQLIRVKVEYKKQEVFIDPYWLGLWLGDGSKSRPGITTMDEKIIKYIDDYASDLKLNHTINLQKNSKSDTHFIVKDNFKPKQKNILLEWMKHYNLINNKHIPKLYLINDRETRLQLLAGIIDSDGYKESNGGYTIVQKRKKLIYQIQELTRSLGFSSYIQKIIKGIKKTGFIGEYYQLRIKGAHGIPCKLKRKQSTETRGQIKDPNISTFTVQPLGKGDYYGFTIDKNHKYLLKDYTVTHNTYTSITVALEFGLKMFIVCPKSIIPAWIEVLKFFKIPEEEINKEGGKFFIVNYGTLRNGKMIHTRYSKRTKFYRKHGIPSVMYDRVECPFITKISKKEYEWNLPDDYLVVYDEIHRCKNIDTANTAALIGAKKSGCKILGMSATIAEDPMKLKAIGYVINLFEELNDFWDWARDHGCSNSGWNNAMVFTRYQETAQHHMKQIHTEIYGGVRRGARMAIADLGDLFPETQITSELYNMNANAIKIQEAYDQMEEQLAILNEREERDYASILTSMLRARQKIELLKVPTFVELIEDYRNSGRSVAIFVNFNQTLDAIAEKLGRNNQPHECIIRGGQGTEERQHWINEFQNNNQDVIICNINAGGVGISLHDKHGSHPRVSIISPNYSAQDLIQALGRVHRGGGLSKSIQRIIFCENTIETKICTSLQAKVANLNLLNDGDMTKGINVKPEDFTDYVKIKIDLRNLENTKEGKKYWAEHYSIKLDDNLQMIL